MMFDARPREIGIDYKPRPKRRGTLQARLVLAGCSGPTKFGMIHRDDIMQQQRDLYAVSAGPGEALRMIDLQVRHVQIAAVIGWRGQFAAQNLRGQHDIGQSRTGRTRAHAVSLGALRPVHARARGIGVAPEPDLDVFEHGVLCGRCAEVPIGTNALEQVLCPVWRQHAGNAGQRCYKCGSIIVRQMLRIGPFDTVDPRWGRTPRPCVNPCYIDIIFHGKIAQL